MKIQKTLLQVDPNFKNKSISNEPLEFFDSTDGQFEINGLYEPKRLGGFMRLPVSLVSDKLKNDGVSQLMYNTSGGRIRFSTDSPYVAVSVELSPVEIMPHMPITGQAGVDIYTGERNSCYTTYKQTFFPSKSFTSNKMLSYTGLCEFDWRHNGIEKEVVIYLPLYSSVIKLHIGLKPGSKILKPTDYKIKNPIVFYGSSITQGGCASRPGNNYVAHLSRWLSADFINLGFSGSCKGEIEMARHIASLNMSAFFMAYDANAPSLEHLENTHFPFYQYIRDKNPVLPIIFTSMPRYPMPHVGIGKYFRHPASAKRIIIESYCRALNDGDNNVYYLDGASLYGATDQDACTVDGLHPNDLGFYRMALNIYPLLKNILYKGREI